MGDIGDDETESEQTELLLECAGDVIPKFGNAMTPDEFVLYFSNILQLLTVRTVSFCYDIEMNATESNLYIIVRINYFTFLYLQSRWA